MRLIIDSTDGDIWGRLEPETTDEVLSLERGVAHGEGTSGLGAEAITRLRALAERPGYPVHITDKRKMDTAPPPWIVVVHRGETALAERLRAIVPPGVPVICDRRERDRRTAARPIPIDRRRQDRRRLPPATWGALRFLITDATEPIWHPGPEGS